MSNTQNLLIKIAKENPDNYLASVIAYYYPRIINKAGKKEVFDFLIYEVDQFERVDIDTITIETDTLDTSLYENKDFRLKSFKISSLRGIPDLGEDKVPFGISLVDDNKVNNAIILANNGVGKSSIFAGLEMIYAQKIGERKLRMHDDSTLNIDYSDYINRFESLQSPICEIDTVNDEFDLKKPIFPKEYLKVFNPSSHFISEYNIIKNGKINFDGDSNDENSFHSIIAKSLGLSEMMDFQSLIKQLNDYRRLRESQALNALEKSKVENETSIINAKTKLQTFYEELKNLTNTQQVTKYNLSKQQNEVRSLLNERLDYSNLIKINNRAISKFIGALTINFERNIQDKELFEKDFLNSGKELLKYSNDCPLCNNSQSSINEIRNLIIRRINKIEQNQKDESSLNESALEVIQNLNIFYNSIKKLIIHIDKEKEAISSHNTLKALYIREEKILMTLKNIIRIFEFSDIESVFIKNSINSKDRREIFNFLNTPSFDSLNYFSSDIEEFMNFREGEVKKWSDRIGNESHADKIILLNREIENLKKHIEERTNYIEIINTKIESATTLAVRVGTIKEYLNEYLNLLDKEASSIVIQSFKKVKVTTEQIINDYLKEDDIKFEIFFDERVLTDENQNEESKQVIVAILKNTKTKKVITPDLYFNTFRYKLLALMVSISLAIATRDKYKINLPLVIDDLFAGSDFVSKNSFSHFLSKVINLFNDHTPDMPLQFIMFTHDDIIFRSAMDCVFDPKTSQINPKLLRDLSEKTMVGRLFKPEDKAETTQEDEMSRKYWNLFYSLPKSIKI